MLSVFLLIVTPVILVDGINQMLKIGKGCCQVSELVILGIVSFC